MAASVTSNEAANTLRTLKQRSQGKIPSVGVSTNAQRSVRDTNKRARVASTGEQKQNQKKKADTTQEQPTIVLYGMERGPIPQNIKGKTQPPTDGPDITVEDEGGGSPPDRGITTEIAAIAAKNEKLQDSVASLQRKFSLREEETHQLLLGLGALNAVANELAALQKDYQERSSKNAALVEESLMQISNCSAQVDKLKRSHGLTATQLQKFRHECTQQISRLVSRLGDLAETTYEHEPFDGNDDDVSCQGVRMSENRQEIDRLRKEINKYRTQIAEEGHISVYGEEHVVPNDEPTAEQFEKQLLEQHRLFWIGEGAG
ncbi:hypothetical protein BBJ29_006259 [Phytophthora kernoviae]|uniref:Uncharacterized protein n=1 Tax=Phytophthora kernoviae TaxID=325452 RepID=A0A3F2RH34_9STRA|nr:hypothetical protein BBJ29_006259 [Phytophthora kernoviae]RLN56724.1 hypothetical protein BBP00_00007860 [Phytophthora kernoviae]